MAFWVYLLLVGKKSQGFNRKIYTGYTQHLHKRIFQHSGLTQTKGARITRKQLIELAYVEKYINRKQAIKREYELKHKSPYNAKEYKLKLIKDFQKHHGKILSDINDKLLEHFNFLDSFVEIAKECEKELLKVI